MQTIATLTAAAAGLFAGLQLAKHLKSSTGHKNRSKNDATGARNGRANARGAKDLGDLVHDPATGIYSPRKR